MSYTPLTKEMFLSFAFQKFQTWEGHSANPWSCDVAAFYFCQLFKLFSLFLSFHVMYTLWRQRGTLLWRFALFKAKLITFNFMQFLGMRSLHMIAELSPMLSTFCSSKMGSFYMGLTNSFNLNWLKWIPIQSKKLKTD